MSFLVRSTISHTQSSISDTGNNAVSVGRVIALFNIPHYALSENKIDSVFLPNARTPTIVAGDFKVKHITWKRRQIILKGRDWRASPSARGWQSKQLTATHSFRTIGTTIQISSISSFWRATSLTRHLFPTFQSCPLTTTLSPWRPNSSIPLLRRTAWRQTSCSGFLLE